MSSRKNRRDSERIASLPVSGTENEKITKGKIRNNYIFPNGIGRWSNGRRIRYSGKNRAFYI